MHSFPSFSAKAWCTGVWTVTTCKYYVTKLHRKISRVCCHLYYECAAWLTMLMATNFSGRAWYYGDNDFIIQPSISLHFQTQHAWLAVPDTDSCVTCSTDTDSHMTCSKNTTFYKLNAAAKISHWLIYIHVSWTYYNNIYFQNCTPKCA